MIFRIVSTILACGVLALGASAQDKPSGEQPKITYDEHVRPIFRDHCLTCHNANDAKGGLTLDTYAKTMSGGSSGEVVLPGDLENSRLYALVAHLEQPVMPPKQDKLAEPKLTTLKKWIESGALENIGSKVVLKKKKTVEFSGGGVGKPAVVAMPENLWRQPVVYTKRPGTLTALAASPWAPIVAIAGQRQIVIYNTDSAEFVGVLPFPEGIPYVLRFSPNGAMLLAGGGRGGHSGFVALYDVKTGRRIAKIGDELDAVLAADINAAHTMVALAGPQRLVRIYSTEGELLHEIKKHTDWVYSLKFSPDGVLLASSDRSGGVFVWEADTAREYLNLRGHSSGVTDVSWRDDSNVLATSGDDGTVKLWEMNDGTQIKSWAAHPGGVTGVAFSHAGGLVTGGKDKTTKTWDGNGNALKAMPAFAESVMRMTFAHDGKRVIAGDWNGEIRVYDAAVATQVATLAANPPTLSMLIDAHSAALAPLESAAAKSASELAASTQALEGKQMSLDAANKALLMANEGMVKIEAEKLAIEKQIVALNAEVKAAGDAISGIQANAKTATDEKNVADKTLADKKALAEESRKKLEETRTILEKTNVEKGVAEKTLAEVTNAKQAAETAGDSAAVSKAEETRASAEKALAALSTKATNLTNALSAIEKDASTVRSELAAATMTATSKTQAAENATTALANAQKILEQKQAAKMAMDQTLVEKSKSLKFSTEQVIAAKTALDKLGEEKTELEKQVVTKKAIADEAAKHVSTVKEKLARTTAEMAAFEQANEKLTLAVNETSKQLAAAQEAMTKAEAQRAEKVAAAKRIAEKADLMKKEYDKLLSEKQALDAEVAVGVQKIQSAQDAASNAQSLSEKAASEKRFFNDAYGVKK